MALNSPRPYMESRRARLSIIIFVIVVTCFALIGSILGALNTAQNARSNARTAAFAACIADYNNQSQASMAARAALNAEQIDLQSDENTAIATLVKTVSTATSKGDVATAFLVYNNTSDSLAKRQAELNKEKAEHPVPPPPSEVCK